MKKYRTIIALITISILITSLTAQNKSNSMGRSDFNEATIRLENQSSSPYEIRFKEDANVTKSNFFDFLAGSSFIFSVDFGIVFSLVAYSTSFSVLNGFI